MLTYGKSTYQQIIDDVLTDINEEAKTASLAPEVVQTWILDAEKKICDSIEVREKWRLSLVTNQSTYPYRDRASITDATNASPIVITSAAHGLANDDLTVINGVGGNVAANGRWQVKNKTTNTFEIYHYAEVTDATNASPINITTAEEHGYATGDSIVIAGVLGNTDANGTHVITVVDALNFTLDGSTGNAAYTSGGSAVKASTGSGAYTSGGRFWSEDEIPTYFKSIIVGDRVWSSVHRQVRPSEINELLALQRQGSELFAAYTSYDAPFSMSDWIDNGERKLLIYPPPQDNETMTLYGRIKINPRLYQTDSLDATIHLSTDYDEAIKYFVAYRVYKAWLKDNKSAAESYALYNDEVNRLRLAFPRNVVQQITYQ